MLSAALRDGTAGRRTTFEVVFAATAMPPVRDGGRDRTVPGKPWASSSSTTCRLDSRRSVPGPATLDYLRGFRFGGDVDGYREGELYFPAPRC
jgi:nicotinate phosphoribosyltransferase